MPESNGTTSTPPDSFTESVTIERLRAEYEAADSFAREVTEFRADVSIPAHNELRYAGHHLLRALGNGDGEPSKEQLHKSISHCQRAMYEAAESGIISALDMIRIFQTDYSTVVVGEIVKDYAEIKERAEAAKMRIAQGRPEVDGTPSIDPIYLETFKAIKKDALHLEHCREDLNKKIEQGRRDVRRFLITTGLTILGIVVALAAIVVMLVMS